MKSTFSRSVVLAMVVVCSVIASSRNESVGGEVDFDTQVIPVLTRYGCNAGACHGAALGRGGFKLSLFGSKPESDHLSLVRELEGRRVNLDDADASLLLRKASESIEHGGGERFSEDAAAYEILRRWIKTGAERAPRRELVEVSVTPREAVLARVDERVPVQVRARFNDGTEEDVTEWTVLTSDDQESVSIDPDANALTVHRKGEHIVIARYLDRVQSIRLALPFSESSNPKNAAGKSNAPSGQTIDDFVNQKLNQLGIPASGQADDSEFARRVWLDLVGRLPTIDELDRFLQDRSAEKRSTLIARLLQSDDFAYFWALKWANTLAIDSRRLQPEGAAAYHQWLIEFFREDRSWQDSAYAMLTSSGDSYDDGKLNFLRSADGPDGVAEAATDILMGVRLRCANCHDHPLDRWTQDDYHGLAAIFAKLKRGRVIADADRGEVTHPVTGQAALPKIPGSEFLPEGTNGREAFARWVTDRANPYFARAAVNRIWAQLMGRGLINPVDDVRATNPASHPRLLLKLEESFRQGGYRFRPLIEMICNSQAYGRTSTPLAGNEFDRVYYSRFIARGLEAEVIANAIADVTGVENRYGNEGITNAMMVTDNRLPSETLDILGRCDRSIGCETGGGGSSSLSRVLHFLNGRLLNERLDAKDGALKQWLSNEADDEKVVELIYMRTLMRRPESQERLFWSSQMSELQNGDGKWSDADSRQQFFADVLWGIITSDTFLSNH